MEIKNQPLEMSLRLAYGLILLRQGELYSAIDEFEYIIRYFKQQNDTKNIIASMNNLAVCFTSLGEYEKALGVYQELVQIDRNANPKDKIIIDFNVSNLSIRLNRIDNVDTIIQRIETLVEENKQLLNYESYKIYLEGTLALRRGNYHQAIKNLREASSEFEFTNNLTLAIDSKYNLSQANYLTGNYSDAIQNLHKILDYQTESQNIIGQIHSLFLLFRIYLELDDQSKLEETYHQIEEISTDYPSVALRQQVANLALQQKISGIDLSEEILGIYDRIENESILDIEFYLFILSLQASYLLDLYAKNNDCELLNKFANIVTEIYKMYSTCKSPELALNALILQYQYSQIMGDQDGLEQFKDEARILAQKHGLKCKLVI
jgi:tetratricopeptide (TPR) repeat protein